MGSKLFVSQIIGILACLNGSPVMSAELPAHIKKCVEETAQLIRSAKSAEDLQKQVEGRVLEFAAGQRTYKRAWWKFDETIRKRGITAYFQKLYSYGFSAAEKAADITAITAVGLDQKQFVGVYANDGGDKINTYNVVVMIETADGGVTNARVLSTIDCKFADVGLVEGSTEIWVSGLLTSDDIP
ncbi:hypothetical protein CL653_00125 [bacterium]|nr:hypothetical protein [bacterium]